ncbi:MAG: hypothetical protein JWO50_119 [Candidatus Kaiserbacteria bacterium]|nr:hypothetical protein [Candidatus Kaiserbacteria bacterium]
MKKTVALYGLMIFFSGAAVISAWTGPTGTAPSNNVAAPINVGTIDQVKNAGLSVNTLLVAGNMLTAGTYLDLAGTNAYLNFGASTGNAGYGIRDNGGSVEVKNSGGAWVSITAGSGSWVVSGTNIYNNNTGNIGIGTTNPTDGKLQVVGVVSISRSGTGTCCSAAGNETLALSENTSVSGRTAKIQFHNSGVNEAFLELTSTGDRRLQISDNQGTTTGLEIAGDLYTKGYHAVRLDSAGKGYLFPWSTPSGNVYVGGAATTNLTVTGNLYGNGFYYNSDRRLKKNIEPMTDNLSKVLRLEPVTYNWINPQFATTTQLGFVAQDVEAIVPELVFTDASTSMKAVDYARVTPLLVGSVQELNQKIADQQKEIDALRQEIESIKNK